jgi:hypothetical protein
MKQEASGFCSAHVLWKTIAHSFAVLPCRPTDVSEHGNTSKIQKNKMLVYLGSAWDELG